METLPFGSRGRFTETFVNAQDDTPMDPSAVSIRLRSPAGVETTYTLAGGDVVRDSMGAYHYEQTFSVSGEWAARWVASGALVATHEFRFRVESTAFAAP